MASGFWKKGWDNYCDVTHFHGFRELHMYKNWWNRVFWIASILGGFGFTAVLMILGIRTYLSQQVSTLVTFNKSGILDTKVMYCPDEWIDSSKLSKYTGPNIEIQLMYAIYFLSQVKLHGASNVLALADPVYQDYAFNASPELFECDRDLIIHEVARLVRDERIPLPAYYSDAAATVMLDIRSQESGNPAERELSKEYYNYYSFSPLRQYYASLYKLDFCNQTEDLFQNVYDFLLINEDNEIVRAAYRNTLMIYEQMKNGNKYPGNRFGCFSLRILDDLERPYRSKSQHDLEGAILNKTNCNVLIKRASEQLGKITSCVSDQQIALQLAYSHFFTQPLKHGSTFEKYRAEKVLNILHEDQGFRTFQERLPDRNISITDYLYNQLDALAKLKHMLSHAEKRFVKELDDNFTAFLNKNHFSSATEFLKDVAVDENKFVSWLSMNREGTMPAYKPNIDTRKVVTKNGVCLQLHLTSQPSEGHSESYADRWHSLFKNEVRTYYFHILELGPIDNLTTQLKSKFPHGGRLPLQTSGMMSKGSTIGTLSFGDAIYDLETCLVASHFYLDSTGIPLPEKSRSFRVLGGLEHYNIFHLTSIEKQIKINRHGSPCKNVDNTDPPFYSYKNCLQTCENYYTEWPFFAVLPATEHGDFNIFKIISGEPCFFAAESLPNGLMDMNLPSLKPCSYHGMMRSFWNYLELGDEDRSWPREVYNFYYSKSDLSKLVFEDQMVHELSSMHSITPKLKECRRSCLEPCSRQYTSVNSITANASEEDYLSINLALYLSCFSIGRTLVEKEPTNRTKGMSDACRRLLIQSRDKFVGLKLKAKRLNRKHWQTDTDELLPRQEDQEKSPSWQDVLCGNRGCINRFVIAINADSTLYEEIITFSWDTIFGIVGGQIGLVMGASCLTIVQLIWVILRTIRDLIGRKFKRKYNVTTDTQQLFCQCHGQRFRYCTMHEESHSFEHV